jgi:hypothetical protein
LKVSFRQNLLPEEGGFAVKRKRFSVEQIVGVLKQAEVGVPVAELIRQVGITEQTLYRWKKQYKGLETDQPFHAKDCFFGSWKLNTEGIFVLREARINWTAFVSR